MISYVYGSYLLILPGLFVTIGYVGSSYILYLCKIYSNNNTNTNADTNDVTDNNTNISDDKYTKLKDKYTKLNNKYTKLNNEYKYSHILYQNLQYKHNVEINYREHLAKCLDDVGKYISENATLKQLLLESKEKLKETQQNLENQINEKNNFMEELCGLLDVDEPNVTNDYTKALNIINCYISGVSLD